MALIQWVDTLSVGIEEIDNQHKKIFEIINKINDALSQLENEKFLPAVFQDLVDYANNHLSTEEMYFEKFNYPEKDPHILAHKAYRDKIADFKKRWEESQSDVADEIVDFLENWWQSHIWNVDKKYAEFFHQHGLK
jgi:hemerythrin